MCEQIEAHDLISCGRSARSPTSGAWLSSGSPCAHRSAACCCLLSRFYNVYVAHCCNSVTVIQIQKGTTENEHSIMPVLRVLLDHVAADRFAPALDGLCVAYFCFLMCVYHFVSFTFALICSMPYDLLLFCVSCLMFQQQPLLCCVASARSFASSRPLAEAPTS